MIGRTLGYYRIVEKLGEGGMGEVYLAEDSRLGRTVALKILPAAVAGDPERRRRFEREARAASVLKHPNVTHIYDVGEEEGVSFIAMEYVEGEGLDRRLASGSLETDELLRLIVQIADALDDAHSQGVIHRDLKPANLLVTARGQAKVLDFGLAKLEPIQDVGQLSQLETQTKTAPGVVMGTVHYMSPEQAMGREVDARSDLFSLGAVLYEMATGKLPFQADSPTEVIDRIVHAHPEAIARFNYEVPQELERIVRKCLEKSPERRYQTARELVVDLKNLRRDTVGGLEAPPSVDATAAAITGGRRRLLLWAAPAAGMVLAITALLVFSGDDSSIDSIAVLPFENATGDPEFQYLCDGLPESLINRLSTLPDLRVISRASSFTFRDRQERPEEVGRELDVRAVLVGRMVERAGVLSISAEMVDVASRGQLWGERFDHALTDVVRVEEEIASSIVRTLRPRLTDADEARPTPNSAANPEAYQLYLKGRWFIIGTAPEMAKAVDYLRQSIELEPGFAPAHAALAGAYTNQAFLTAVGRDEVLGRARAAVERAVALDPNLSEAHTADAVVRLYFDRDLQAAERAIRRAIELGPAKAEAWTEYGTYLLCTGRIDEAIEAARKAVSLDPMSITPTHDLGIAYLTAGDYEKAATQFRKTLELRPAWIWGHVKLGISLSRMGRHQEAVAEARRAEEIAQGNASPMTRSWLAWIHAKAGDAPRAEELLAETLALKGERYVDPQVEAVFHAALNHPPDMVLEALERSYEEDSVFLIYLGVSAGGFFRDYSSDPRYQELLRKVKLR